MSSWLISLDGMLVGRRFSLDAPCLVGRGPYNHVVLDDTRISRQHAKISPEGGGHVVYDLNSANGTFVNEEPVKRQRLEPEDVVRFGPYRFKVEAAPVPEDEPPRARATRFEEVNTQVGVELPVQIIDSLDAISTTFPPVKPSGLRELEEAERKLRTLYGFMQAIATTLKTRDLLDQIVRNVFEIYPMAEEVSLYTPEQDNGRMVSRRAEHRSGKPAAAVTLPPQFQIEVVERARSVLTAPQGEDGEERAPSSGRSMHAPIIWNGVVQGVLHVRGGAPGTAPFSQGDLDLLTGLAAQAAMALQNARMHQESLKQERLRQDLLLAGHIQRSFLPQQLPNIEGLEFAVRYRAAYAVGGDFYDVLPVGRSRIGVFIGDVSGKGVSAALLMARIASDLRVAASLESEPARVLERVNQAVIERGQPDIFVTGIYLTLDIGSHEVVLANAGHLPPMVRRRARGSVERIEGGSGTAIGIFEDTVFPQTSLKLWPGDTLVLCTDGVLEATDGKGEQFGFERIELSLGEELSRAGEVSARLERHLKVHVGEAAQTDDLTILAIGVAGPVTLKGASRADQSTNDLPVYETDTDRTYKV